MTDRDRSKDPWCTNCQHIHIPSIPEVTYLCDSCGWGQWYPEDALAHMESCPGHLPYAVTHRLVAEQPRS